MLDPASPALDALEAYGRSGRFLRQTLAAFDWGEFLEKLGVETEREEDGIRSGSIYVRGGARRMLDALLGEARKLGVEIISGEAVISAKKFADGTFEVRTAGLERKCTRLILATGGTTYTSTGSTGDGYRLAESFGHAVETPRPALGAVVTLPSFAKLAGVSVADASVTLRRNGHTIATRRGGLLFTHYGLSGPAVLDLSLELARASGTPEDFAGAQLVADLAPGETREQVEEGFLAISRSRAKRRVENAGLSSTLSARLVTELARLAGIDPTRRMDQIMRREVAALAANVKALVQTVKEPLDPDEAMVTVGGVVTQGLDPHTMESRRVPGLCFAGELLSPAGPCGGYNLLMAFATGQAAGSGTSGTKSQPEEEANTFTTKAPGKTIRDNKE